MSSKTFFNKHFIKLAVFTGQEIVNTRKMQTEVSRLYTFISILSVPIIDLTKQDNCTISFTLSKKNIGFSA